MPASFSLGGGLEGETQGGKWRRPRRYRTHVRESRPQPLPYMSRVVVIGGGVIGCAVAELLSRHGHELTLLERDQLGSHASGAAAGELSPSARPGDHESLAMFPELVARIEQDSAMSVEYRVQQGLGPAFREEEAKLRKTEPGRWLDAAELRALEPSLSAEAVGAMLIEHAHLTPPRFVRALGRAAVKHGAEICEGTPAIGFQIEHGQATAVQTTAGAIAADWIVIAAGPWSREVGSSAHLDLDVRPQRGQLAALDAGETILRRSIFWSGGYLVPKGDGTIIAGGTEEDAGFDERPTVDGISTLLALAIRLVPTLNDATLLRVWAGLRPVTSSGDPIVSTTSLRNVVVATGHHRKGILLAPLAAKQVAELITSS
ncbi:MAG TPA: FAD-dependent oxidoreductase [Candidatus Dormibacteraeota bacterium]|nr:FAD-dependent oxidoreductase [Candidatus Dormibacteraeota bacterium]